MNNNNSLVKPKVSTIWLYILPGFLLYIFTVIWPVINAFYYSLFRWSGGPVMRYVGLKNYLILLNDGLFWSSFANNLFITVLCVLGQIGIALIIAMMLTSRYVKLKEFHRTVIFFPVVLSGIVIGFIWTIMYNKDYGLINEFLRLLNLDFLIVPWLDNPRYVIFSISLPLIWQFIGFYMVILMAGMTNITKEIFEMAEIDGAEGWRKMLYITVPLVKPTLIVTIMLCIAGNMKIFDHILVMTGGGPGNSSMVMAMYAYNNSFNMHKLGYGSAISIGILVLSLIIILVTRLISSMGGGSEE